MQVQECDTLGVYARNFDDIAAVHAIIQGKPPVPLANGFVEEGRAPKIAVWYSSKNDEFSFKIMEFVFKIMDWKAPPGLGGGDERYKPR